MSETVEQAFKEWSLLKPDFDIEASWSFKAEFEAFAAGAEWAKADRLTEEVRAVVQAAKKLSRRMKPIGNYGDALRLLDDAVTALEQAEARDGEVKDGS